jgi:hypothetical protein
LATIGAAFLLAFSASAEAPSNFVTVGPFGVTSDGKSELSSSDYRISIKSDGILKIKYLAPRSHCSSIKIHFGVDGAQKSVSEPVRPGDTTGYVDLGPVSPGDHIVSLRGEGIAGGCNSGTITSWGGSAIVETSGQSQDNAADDLGPLVFDWSYTNWAWGYVHRGCYIAADGDVYSYAYPRGAVPPHQAADASGSLTQSDLLEEFDSGRKLMGHLSQTQLDEMRGFGALAHRAASAKIEGRQAANDAGSATLQVFVRYQRMTVMKPSRPEPILYRPVLLEEHGDWERKNVSEAAKTMSAWYAGVAHKAECAPR